MQLLWPFCLVGVQTSLEHLVLAHPVGLTASLKVAGNSLARLDRLDRRRRRWWSWSGRGRCCCLHLGRIPDLGGGGPGGGPGGGGPGGGGGTGGGGKCIAGMEGHMYMYGGHGNGQGGHGGNFARHQCGTGGGLGGIRCLDGGGGGGKLGCLGVIFFAAAASSCSFTGSSPTPPQPVSQPCLSSPSPLRPPLLLVVIIFGVADRSLGTVTVRHAVQWQLCVTVSSQGNLSQPHDT